MPSKFGEFRFLGNKPGKTMKVDAQAQRKQGPQAPWIKCTASFTVGNTSVGIARGVVEGTKDADPGNPGTTWQAQDMAESDYKRIVVRVREMTGAQVTSDKGYIIVPNPPMGEAMVGGALTILASSVKCFAMKSASIAVVAGHASGTWNSGEYKFLP